MAGEGMIFLSHTGAQKPFVRTLNTLLSYMGCKTFVDEADLPAAERYEPRIWEAAGQCRMAVVVLSDEFFCKKWPMKELLYFIERAERDGGFRMLPLFYRIAVRELDHGERWHGHWRDNGLDVGKCEHAIKTLGRYSGVVCDPHWSDEHCAERCKEAIIQPQNDVAPAWLKHFRKHGAWP